jgi:hypothetical protein
MGMLLKETCDAIEQTIMTNYETKEIVLFSSIWLFFKFARAGEWTRDLLILFILHCITLPQSHSGSPFRQYYFIFLGMACLFATELCSKFRTLFSSLVMYYELKLCNIGLAAFSAEAAVRQQRGRRIRKCVLTANYVGRKSGQHGSGVYFSSSFRKKRVLVNSWRSLLSWPVPTFRESILRISPYFGQNFSGTCFLWGIYGHNCIRNYRQKLTDI